MMTTSLSYYLKKTITCSFFLYSIMGIAQNESNIWYFGENAGLDFNTDPPTPLTDGEINTREGCSSIANEDGELLFYTDGITVWNKEHAIMTNGTGLKGHPSSTQSSIIVPQPGSNNIYIVFTVDANGTEGEGLNYSKIDISLNGGLGEVTDKNIPLLSTADEKLTAVTHTNGEHIWVIAHEAGSNTFYTYLVTNIGVNTTPNTWSIGTTYTNPAGAMKVSPDGRYLATAIPTKAVELFDFNAETGEIENNKTILEAQGFEFYYGIEFSPNSEVLYVGLLDTIIYQFDLTDTNITSSQTIVSINSYVPPGGGIFASHKLTGSLQLAPDGKIYVAKEGATALDVIQSPNNLGVACDYDTLAVDLSGKKVRLGFPQFIQSYFESVGETMEAKDTIYPQITVPNVFTPNGDGDNDLFYIDGMVNMKEILVKIYTQWGNLVFENTNPTVFWDGKTNNSSDATEGTYFYVIEGVLNGEEQQYKGMFTLLR